LLTGKDKKISLISNTLKFLSLYISSIFSCPDLNIQSLKQSGLI